MILRAIEYMKTVQHVLLAVLLFGMLAVTEQISNGLFGTKFIIKDLIDIFTWIFSQLSLKYAADSWLNTHVGEMPK